MKQKRTRAYTRHQRRRVIKRKLLIIRNVWSQEAHLLQVEGKLSKGKIHCSCRMCRFEQFHKIPKSKVKAKLKAMKEEMDE